MPITETACGDNVGPLTRLVRHSRYAIFHMAAAVLPREVFAGILDLINTLRGPPTEAASV